MSMILSSSPENMIQVPKPPQPFDLNQICSISHRAFHKQVTGDFGTCIVFSGELLSIMLIAFEELVPGAGAGAENTAAGAVMVAAH